DSRLLAAGGRHQPISLWDVGTGKERFALEALPEDVRTIAFSPDGRLVAAGDAEGVVYLWEVSTGKVRRRLEGHRGAIRPLAFSPAGKTLTSASAGSSALVWDVTGPLRDGRPRTALRSAAERERLWADLAGEAGRADDAIRDLIAVPADAVPFLKDRL